MDKKLKTKNAAAKITTHLVNAVPQTVDGQITWYYSGSLAINLYASAKSMRFVTLDKNWRVVDFSNNTTPVHSDAKNYFTLGVRKISQDIDLVAKSPSISNEMWSVANTKNLRTQFPDDIGELCSYWATGKMTGAFLDILNDERTFNGHHIAELTLENGDKIYTLNPIDLLFHKISETIVAQGKDNTKYQKNLGDISSLLNALSSMGLLDENSFEQIVQIAGINGRESGIHKAFNKPEGEVLGKLETLQKDLNPLITEENKETFNTVFEGLNTFATTYSSNSDITSIDD